MPKLTSDHLADIGLFGGLSKETLETLASSLPTSRIEAGALVVEEGDLSTQMFVVVAGELEVVTRPPRRHNTRIILMMDVGGSMDPFAHLCSRLFSAAKKSSHFKELRTYYFHNCVYGHVYETERFDTPIKVRDLIHEAGPHYKLIMVGDALMAPYELLAAGGSLDLGDDRGIEGLQWLMMLSQHYHRSIWLNPEPQRYWTGNTIEYVRQTFDMFPLTLEGLGEGVGHLLKGGKGH